MQTQQVLSVLRGAVRELSSSSQAGTPTADGTRQAPTVDSSAAAPSNAHLLLQVSALHKAFLSLSEVFMEELNGRQVEQEEQRQALQSVRRECAGKLQVAAALQAEVQQLVAADGQQAHSQALLAKRCGQLEREIARLRQQLEERDAQLEQAVEHSVARQLVAAQQQWQQHLLPHAAEHAVQQWAADALPALLQPMQDAVAATAELTAGVAADVASLTGRLEQLAEWCGRADAADQNHEQRLCRLEESDMQRAGATSDGAALEQLQQQVAALQLGHARLDAGLQQMRQEQEGAAAATAEHQLKLQQCTLRSYEQQQQADYSPELPALRQQLAAVADQQVQQAKTTEQLVTSVAADVMALARHIRALDREMRSLRRETQQTQHSLLQSCSVFSRALAIPSPVGPFTSLPPQL